MENYTFTIEEEDQGERLDKFLAKVCPLLTRSHVQNLIIRGHVNIGDQTDLQRKHKLKVGDVVELVVPEPIDAEPEPQDIPLDIIFEDEHFLVVNKAAGMVVHPAYGNPDKTLVNALLHHCGDNLSGIRGVKLPGIVHRLDKDTSGLMVVAKSDAAHQGLSKQFIEKTLFRRYMALVYGVPSPAEGEIEGNIGRHPTVRQRMGILKYGGKEALTFYKVKKVYAVRASLVECRLHSGRTHQIRVHMTSIGHPLLGDPVYGKTPKWMHTDEFADLKEYIKEHKQQALHAYQLELLHPITGETMSFEAPLTEYFKGLQERLEK